MEGSHDLRDIVDGPFTFTFTAHLPFLLGIPDELGHTIGFDTTYVDAKDVARYGEHPTVDIRVFTFETPGLPMWPKGAHEALKRFYGYALEGEAEERFGDESLIAQDQWITLETPSAVVAGEDPAVDPAYAFHRCLSAFNLFLEAVLVATKDVRIRAITSHDLRPVVFVGALMPDGEWQLLTAMLLHPEALPDSLPVGDGPITEAQLDGGLRAILTAQPYVTTIIWRSRAQRALQQTGDPADAIISFQVAAESLLFDTYRMLLVDEGLSSAQLQTELDTDRPFKSLLVKVMPSKLGGQWDVTQKGTAVGEYWENLYLVRNSIIHSGMRPHGGHAEAAQSAYRRLRDHLEERLLAKRNTYPRATLARFADAGRIITHLGRSKSHPP